MIAFESSRKKNFFRLTCTGGGRVSSCWWHHGDAHPSSYVEYLKLKAPKKGSKINGSNGYQKVPAEPIIPFIPGDATGPDIWQVAMRVFDAAVKKA